MEIGSEFWLENHEENEIENKIRVKNEKYFLSGRTAIDYAIDILEQNKKIENVYFPSYGCNSMLQPFFERNIKVEFYKVSFKHGDIIYDIDCNKKCDVFYAMNYFGFSAYNMDYQIDKFKEKNTYIIEDSTHSWLSKRKYNKKSDLVVASLRKWFPIMSGAVLVNQLNKFDIDEQHKKLKENKKYIELKKEAMLEKAKYIYNNEEINKKSFLRKYAETSEILEKDYKNYKIDKESYNILNAIDVEEIVAKRRKNVSEIYKFLTKQNEIQYLTKINLEEDCPIFVPIFLEKEEKNKLKNYLIENEIYCPVHWNIPEQIKDETEKEIYEKELSLVCDQRYEVTHIKRYINLIKNKGL